MINKKKNYLQKNYAYFLTLFSIIFFFYGFISEENSAGAGGYNGDFGNSWITLQNFLNNDVFTAIKTSGDILSDQRSYISSRPPLIWILNKFLNPFTNNQFEWIKSIFFFSLLAPILFYYCLKLKFPRIENNKLILLSTIILLSPYFRTSSYWALEENYGIIFTLISYIIFNSYLKKNKPFLIKFFKLFILTLSSSMCVYLDQKLIIIPLYFFFKILLSSDKNFLKLSLIIFYLVFALPFLYLIVLWENIIPSVDAFARGTGAVFHLSHIGFSLTIIGFYFIPLFFFKSESINSLLHLYFKKKVNIFFFLLFFFYLIISYIFDNYQGIPLSNLGKGFIHKISILISSEFYFQKLFVYICFIFFYFIVFLFLHLKFLETLIIVYFVLSSVFIHPLQQEYFDPLLYIIFFLFFGYKIKFAYKNIFILYFYSLFFLLTAKIYYLKKIPFIF